MRWRFEGNQLGNQGCDSSQGSICQLFKAVNPQHQGIPT